MMKFRVLITSFFATVLTAGVLLALPAFAQSDEPVNDTDDTSFSERRDELRQRAQAAREAAKERITQLRADIQEKLGERRMQACERHEPQINDVIQRSAAQSEKHLGVFQTIAERVIQFKEDKQLSPEDYDAVVEAMQEKETAALEAIETAQATVFDCDSESTGKQFSGLVRETVKTQHTALKDYRKSIVDLIKAVKQSIEGTAAVEDESGEE